MRQEYSGTLLQSEAIKILLNPEDAMALGHGIAFVIKEGLIERYAREFEAVSASPILQELSLDLKGAGLKGPYKKLTRVEILEIHINTSRAMKASQK
jgi:hypothetical protein